MKQYKLNHHYAEPEQKKCSTQIRPLPLLRKASYGIQQATLQLYIQSVTNLNAIHPESAVETYQLGYGGVGYSDMHRLYG